jgi:hypothetical protein
MEEAFQKDRRLPMYTITQIIHYFCFSGVPTVYALVLNRISVFHQAFFIKPTVYWLFPSNTMPKYLYGKATFCSTIQDSNNLQV